MSLCPCSPGCSAHYSVDVLCCYMQLCCEDAVADVLSLPAGWWQWDSLIPTSCGGYDRLIAGTRSCSLLLSYCPGFLWAFCPFLLVPFRKLLSSWWGLGSVHFSSGTVSLSTLLCLSIPSSLRQCRGRKAFTPHQNRKQQGPCSLLHWLFINPSKPESHFLFWVYTWQVGSRRCSY